MANPVKKQLKKAKKEEAQFNKQQEAKNIRLRIEARKNGTPVPAGAEEKPGWFSSTPAQAISTKTNTPEQEQLIQSLSALIPNGLQNLNLPGSQSNFEPIAQEARRNFSQNTIPTLAERFAGLGRGSSGLEQTLGGAGAEFESRLAAAQAQHGLQEQGLQSNNLGNLLNLSLRPQFDYYAQPGQKSFARESFDTLLPIAGEAAAGYLKGGPIAAAAGGVKGLNDAQTKRNGSGAGANSFGFSGVKHPEWQQYGGGAQNMSYKDILNSLTKPS